MGTDHEARLLSVKARTALESTVLAGTVLLGIESQFCTGSTSLLARSTYPRHHIAQTPSQPPTRYNHPENKTASTATTAAPGEPTREGGGGSKSTEGSTCTERIAWRILYATSPPTCAAICWSCWLANASTSPFVPSSDALGDTEKLGHDNGRRVEFSMSSLPHGPNAGSCISRSRPPQPHFSRDRGMVHPPEPRSETSGPAAAPVGPLRARGACLPLGVRRAAPI